MAKRPSKQPQPIGPDDLASEATFFQTDVRGAMLAGWNLRQHDLRGVIISPAQFEALATELGILVVEP